MNHIFDKGLVRTCKLKITLTISSNWEYIKLSKLSSKKTNHPIF